MMAERRPVRSSSRRTGPQVSIHSKAPSPPQQTKRITRSQSREISDAETGLGNVQAVRHSARGSIVENVGGKGVRKTKQGTGRRAVQDLPTVTEADDSTLRYPSLPGEDNKEITQRDGRDTKSPGNMSAMSGTTAQTSFSAQELADMNSDEMLDALPDLCEAADKVLNFVAHHDTSPDSLAIFVKQLEDSSSRTQKTLTRLGDSLQLHKRPFGNESYVNLSIGLRGLLGIRHVGNVRDGTWRPDDIFYKANLATMITRLLASQESSSSSQSAVEKMERDFPSPFFSRLLDSLESTTSVGCSFLSSESFKVALDLRTQYFIMLVQRHLLQPNFDPDLLLLQVFCETEDSLKGWDAEGMRTQDFGIEIQNAISGRINVIKETFREDSQSVQTGQLVDLDRLRHMYPWSTFIMEVLSWGRLRNSEIQAEIKSRGSIEGIMQSLEIEIRERALSYATDDAGTEGGNSPHIQIDYHPASDLTSEQVNLSMQAPVVGSKRSLNRQFDSPGNIRFSKEFFVAKAAELSAQRQTARPPPAQAAKLQATVAGPSTQMIAPKSRADLPINPSTAPARIANELSGHERDDAEFQPLIEDDEIHLIEEREHSPTTRIIELEDEASREQDKENIPQRAEATLKSSSRSFIDRQPNAKKITFESQPATQQGPTTVPRSQRQPPITELRDECEDQLSSLSEDEGFQEDNRKNFRPQQIPARSTKRGAPVAASRSPAKRMQHAPERQEEREESVDLDPEYMEATRNASNAIVPSQGEMYRTVNTQSKAVTRVRVPKKIQVRRPWSEAETDRLIDLIEEHGISWAYIRSIDAGNGGVLGYRDQVGLKDKARNMKFDYLKAGIALPQNFEQIPLAKAQKDKLRVIGMLDESDEGDDE